MKIKFLLFFLCFSTKVLSQEKLLCSGQIVGTDGLGISKATVYLNGTSIYDISNKSGNFKLKNAPKGLNILVIEAEGYQKKTLKLNIIENIEGHIIYPIPQAFRPLEKIQIIHTPEHQGFVKSLLGVSDFAEQCTIKNLETLSFGTSGDTSVAFAFRPLEVINASTGFNCIISLDSYAATQYSQAMIYTHYFKETINDDKTKIDQNRKDVYYGSYEHFKKALVLNQLKENGFYLYKIDTSFAFKNPFKENLKGRLKETNQLDSEGLYEVLFPSISVSSGYKNLETARSFIKYNGKRLDKSMVFGFMDREGIASALPSNLNFAKPTSGFKAIDTSSVRKVLPIFSFQQDTLSVILNFHKPIDISSLKMIINENEELKTSKTNVENDPIFANALSEVIITAKKNKKEPNSMLIQPEYIISKEQLQGNPTSDIILALEGKVPGLQVIDGYNEEGLRAYRLTFLRDRNSTKEPLILINGIPFSGTAIELSMAVRKESVEKIEVRKSLNSIYGVRGAHGVINIITHETTNAKAINLKNNLKKGNIQVQNISRINATFLNVNTNFNNDLILTGKYADGEVINEIIQVD